MQQVREGTTMSGVRGLFTGGFLASPLPKNWDTWTIDQRNAWCARMQFELVVS